MSTEAGTGPTSPAAAAPATGPLRSAAVPVEAPLYRIGVDGGGSGTRARLVQADGLLLGEGHSGASNLAQGIDQAWRHVLEAIQQAQQSAAMAGLPPPTPANTALGLGLAGANNAQLHQQFVQRNPGYQLLRLQSDAFTTLLGAHGGAPGAILAVGTGSVGLARFADGSLRSVGGWGFPSGDDGSGALLGLRAMNRTQRALDGMHAGGALTQAVLRATGGTRAAMLEWCCAAGQTRFASLAPLVFDCAAQDPAATALLAEAVQCLERMALALDPQQTLPLALLGGIGRRLLPYLPAALQARLVPPQGDAMDGALRLLTPTETAPEPAAD